jgi:hypothetical protein
MNGTLVDNFRSVVMEMQGIFGDVDIFGYEFLNSDL